MKIEEDDKEINYASGDKEIASIEIKNRHKFAKSIPVLLPNAFLEPLIGKAVFAIVNGKGAWSIGTDLTGPFYLHRCVHCRKLFGSIAITRRFCSPECDSDLKRKYYLRGMAAWCGPGRKKR